MSDCIFCKIVNREISATVVCEDEDLLAFLDIAPVVKGHILIISKQHCNSILSTPDEVISKLYLKAKQIAQAQMNALGADGVNIFQNNGKAAGQEVEHIHIHVIPRFEEDGHRWNWNAKKYENFNEMTAIADMLKDQLF